MTHIWHCAYFAYVCHTVQSVTEVAQCVAHSRYEISSISQAPNGFQDRESFKNVRQWMQEIDKYAPAIVNKMLVATKTDLVSKRVVPRTDSMPVTVHPGCFVKQVC